MIRRIYFGKFDGHSWPSPEELRGCFLTAEGRKECFGNDNDSWGLTAEGVDSTEHLRANAGRIDIHLALVGNPDHGVLLQYRKWGGPTKQTYYSKGNLNLLFEHVITTHGDRMPLGLYIPFDAAWGAVKEFIERDGSLARSIEWIASRDLPRHVFSEQ